MLAGYIRTWNALHSAATHDICRDVCTLQPPSKWTPWPSHTIVTTIYIDDNIHPLLLHPLSLFHSEFNGGKCSQPKSISSSPSVCLWGTIRQRAYPLCRPSSISGVLSTILDREDSSCLMQIALSRMKRHRTLCKYFTLRVCIVLGTYFFVIHFAFKFMFTIKARRSFSLEN